MNAAVENLLAAPRRDAASTPRPQGEQAGFDDVLTSLREHLTHQGQPTHVDHRGKTADSQSNGASDTAADSQTHSSQASRSDEVQAVQAEHVDQNDKPEDQADGREPDAKTEQAQNQSPSAEQVAEPDKTTEPTHATAGKPQQIHNNSDSPDFSASDEKSESTGQTGRPAGSEPTVNPEKTAAVAASRNVARGEARVAASDSASSSESVATSERADKAGSARGDSTQPVQKRLPEGMNPVSAESQADNDTPDSPPLADKQLEETKPSTNSEAQTESSQPTVSAANISRPSQADTARVVPEETSSQTAAPDQPSNPSSIESSPAATSSARPVAEGTQTASTSVTPTKTSDVPGPAAGASGSPPAAGHGDAVSAGASDAGGKSDSPEEHANQNNKSGNGDHARTDQRAGPPRQPVASTSESPDHQPTQTTTQQRLDGSAERALDAAQHKEAPPPSGSPDTSSAPSQAQSATMTQTVSASESSDARATATVQLASQVDAGSTTTSATRSNSASANTAAPQMPQTMNDLSQTESQQVVDRTLRGLSSAMAQRGGSVTLRLTPPDLGSLRIVVQMNGGVVQANFQASSGAVGDLLSQHMNTLRQALESHGLTVERLQVQAQPAPGASHSHGQGTGQQNQSATDGQSRGLFRDDTQGDERQGQNDRRHPSEQRQQRSFRNQFLNLVA